MTPLQTVLYNHFLKSKAVANVLSEDEVAKPIAQVLPLITSLKKLCNHPRLVYDEARQSQSVRVICVLTLLLLGHVIVRDASCACGQFIYQLICVYA